MSLGGPSAALVCSSCKKDEVYASRYRNQTERVLAQLFPVRFYRCHACNRRVPRVLWRLRPILESLGLLALAFLVVYTLLVFTGVVR